MVSSDCCKLFCEVEEPMCLEIEKKKVKSKEDNDLKISNEYGNQEEYNCCEIAVKEKCCNSEEEFRFYGNLIWPITTFICILIFFKKINMIFDSLSILISKIKEGSYGSFAVSLKTKRNKIYQN